MGFGSVLKDILAEKKMTIKELSEATGIPLNTLYSITKRDTVNVRQETIEKISSALSVTNDELIKRLQQNIHDTQLQLVTLQERLREAECRRHKEIENRKRLAESLYHLTNYEFTEEEISIIISTAILLKEPPTTE